MKTAAEWISTLKDGAAGSPERMVVLDHSHTLARVIDRVQRDAFESGAKAQMERDALTDQLAGLRFTPAPFPGETK